jgi:hypothetical protein
MPPVPPIAIPATGLRLPAFWEAVRAIEPAAFAEAYPAPFLLQLASLKEEEMLPEARRSARDSGPTISASSGRLKGIALLPWEETRVVTLTKRTDTFPTQVTVGRSTDCDVVLASPLASKRHAMVERQGEVWVLTDVGSRNGTTVGGEPVGRMHPTPIDFGVELGFGDTRWLFVLPFFFHHAVKTLLPRDAAG